ncbi:uncharacterized protein LOC133481962 [Phyllopteryx taeniolatus]|uniref:uncharacterized protein LOC133481962 n=1 Tax=Phyllopteryx taeniolatus TaxID=161469 RepID=UPI002AD3B5D6|nr:uncharacterized protein LOC133481962 [Phyllopteryx taeniolatus]
MDDELISLGALYLLWKSQKRRRVKHRRAWVNNTIQRRTQLGEFHGLLQELRLDDGRFQRYLTLSRSQFEDLFTRIGARISRMDTNYRRSVSAAERLSICLRYFTTGDSFRSIADSFCVGVSTVSMIVRDVATAIWDCLVDEFMAVPTANEWRSIAEAFEERWNFPLCCGALDGKHIVLKAPGKSGLKLKGPFSLVLLAVVDAQYCFRVIDVRGCRRTTDGGVLANSAFGQALRSGTLQLPADLPLPGADHRGPQPHIFVADKAFPLQKNLMRPFPGRIIPKEHRIFNYRLSRARLVVENAFGVLSAQWRMYRRDMAAHYEVAEKCVKATCLLHNFLRKTTQASAVRGGIQFEEVEPLPGLGRLAANNSTREARRVREAFTAFFSAEGTVPWQDAGIYDKDTRTYKLDDLTKLKTSELKAELQCRGLNVNGLKPDLVERLSAALNKEARAKSSGLGTEEQGDMEEGQKMQVQQGDVLLKKDEDRDSGGYYKEEETEPEAECKPYVSQPVSYSGHSVLHFGANVDLPKTDAVTKIVVKLEQNEEKHVDIKQGA